MSVKRCYMTELKSESVVKFEVIGPPKFVCVCVCVCVDGGGGLGSEAHQYRGLFVCV
jgi:hypothetical protein